MRPEQKNSDDVAIRRNGSGEHLAVTLRDALMPVFRQRRLATIIFIGIFVGAVLSALLLPPTYEAEMKILVNQDRVDPVITSDADIQRGSTVVSAVSEEDLNSEVELLKSRDLLEKVVLASGLESKDEPPWEKPSIESKTPFGVFSPPPKWNWRVPCNCLKIHWSLIL